MFQPNVAYNIRKKKAQKTANPMQSSKIKNVVWRAECYVLLNRMQDYIWDSAGEACSIETL